MKKVSLQMLVLIVSLIYSGVTAQNSDFKPSGTLSGYVFGDYYWKQHSDSAGRGGKNVEFSPTMTSTPGAVNGNAGSTGANAFLIRRAYLQYDYDLTQKLSAHATLANEQNLDANGYNTTYLKYMYIKYANIFKGSNLFFGQMPTPSFGMTPTGTEPLWGYRSIERTIMDMHNIDASSDMGIALQGNLLQQKVANDTIKPNLLGYEVMVGNGNSAKPAANIFKKFRGTVYTALLQQKLNFGFYMDYAITQLSPVHQDYYTYKLYADYKTKLFNIGAEVFEQNDANSDEYMNGTTAVWVNGLQLGYSVWVTGKILKDLNFFARYDMYNPDTKFNITYETTYKATDYGSVANLAALKTNTSSYTQSFTSVGLDYTLTKRIHIMPNLWYNYYKSQLTDVYHHAKSDYDLVPRVTFYVIFNNSKKVQNNGMDM